MWYINKCEHRHTTHIKNKKEKPWWSSSEETAWGLFNLLLCWEDHLDRILEMFHNIKMIERSLVGFRLKTGWL